VLTALITLGPIVSIGACPSACGASGCALNQTLALAPLNQLRHTSLADSSGPAKPGCSCPSSSAGGLLNPRRHLVFVGSHCSLVMLSKTSEATHGTYIGEASWDAFASRHPLLMARLMAGEGVWILGSRHA
jgi:hypothetical protein